MIHWGWFVGSWIVNACVVIPALGFWLNSKHRAERLQLRVALERLVGAVDSGNWRPYRDTETGRQTLEALERARDVLGRKGAE